MNILILNWRDIKNPKSGGAEILTHEIAKRLTGKGYRVTQFSSNFPGCKSEENIDGVRIIRSGNPDLRTVFSSVHFKAYRWYEKNKNLIDIVIDEIHGVPFFTPLYVKKKKYALICEFAGSLWDKAVAPPFNFLGKFVEKMYPFLYSSSEIITISESSSKEIHEELFKGKKISIIHPGCSAPVLKKSVKKANILTLVFIARLSKTKGMEDAIEVVKKISDNNVKVKLHVLGRGEDYYVSRIKKQIKKYNLGKNIIVHGFVQERKKINIIDSSHFLIIPSQKEGWGLTVHEVNARGVPVVGYNIPGIRDVIKTGINGILLKENSPDKMAQEILTLYNDKKKYNSIAKKSIEERKKFSWDNTVSELEKIINS